jgi:hypothetical protein
MSMSRLRCRINLESSQERRQLPSEDPADEELDIGTFRTSTFSRLALSIWSELDSLTDCLEIP